MGNLWETKIIWFKIWLPMFDFCISLKIVFVFLWKVYFNFFANCVCICVSRTKLACSGRPLRGRGKEEPRRTWTCLPPVRDQRDFLFLMSRYFLLTKKRYLPPVRDQKIFPFFAKIYFLFFPMLRKYFLNYKKKYQTDFLILSKDISYVKKTHRKNCKRCPVSLFIVR